MRGTPLDILRVVEGKLRRLKPLAPCALFLTVLGALGALAAAADTRSLLLILAGVIVLVASVAALAAWILIADRRATQRPEHVAHKQDEWRDFEARFWCEGTGIRMRGRRTRAKSTGQEVVRLERLRRRLWRCWVPLSGGAAWGKALRQIHELPEAPKIERRPVEPA